MSTKKRDEDRSQKDLIHELKKLRKKVVHLKTEKTEIQQFADLSCIERDNLNNILQAMEDGVYIVNKEFNIQYVNQVLIKEFGAYEGRRCYEYFHDRKESCPWCKNAEVFKGNTVRWEWHLQKNNKTYELIDTPIKNADGSVLKLEILRDITESKRVEEELKKSEQRLYTLTKITPTYIYEIDSKGIILFANRTYKGLTREDVEGTQLESWYPDDLKDKIRSIIDLTISTKQPQKIDYDIPNPDGKKISYTVDVSPIIIDGQKTTVVWTSTDITERKKSEQILKESEERFRAIFEQAAIGVALLNTRTGKYIRINQKYCEFLGYTKQEMLNKTFMEVTFSEDIETNINKNTKLMKGESTKFSFEKRYVCKDGKIVWGNLTISPLWKAGDIPEFHYHIAIVEDIDNRKKAEALIKKKQEELEFLIDSIRAMIFYKDSEGRFIRVNKALADFTGIPKKNWIGKTVFDIYPKTAELYTKDDEEVINSGKAKTGIIEPLKTSDGIKTVLTDKIPTKDNNGKVIGLIGFTIDISELKQAEEEKIKLESQLMQSRNMEAIGTLAGGIAHQFNNALSGIIGNIELLEDDLSGDKNLTDYVKNIKISSIQMAKLTKQLLAYARGGKYQEKIILGSDIIRDTLPLIKHTIAADIYIDTDIPVHVFFIKVDIIQIQMVLSAIMTNASEAIEGSGRIRVICKNEVISDKKARHFPELKTGNYVCIKIEDDGTGMDKETKNRIFEPFFTTKITGRGLGMAAAYGIIKNHCGYINVDSKLGRGTSVTVYLPAIETITKVPEEQKIEMETAEVGATIFVIEDEEMVMELINAQLERLNYRVLSAGTGKEAIEFVKSFDGDIDLVILDMILPDMGGKEIYKQIKKARPKLKVIICSGYSIDGPAREVLNDGAEDFIQKPFRRTELSKKLRKVLESKK